MPMGLMGEVGAGIAGLLEIERVLAGDEATEAGEGGDFTEPGCVLDEADDLDGFAKVFVTAGPAAMLPAFTIQECLGVAP